MKNSERLLYIFLILDSVIDAPPTQTKENK